MRPFRKHVVVLLISFAALVNAACLEAQSRGQAPPDLKARNAAFLSMVDARPPEQLASFFPTAGDFVYRHTVYTEDSSFVRMDTVRTGEVSAALAGTLWPVFTAQVEGQVIGLFAHQLLLRGRQWRYVGGNRFVPPEAGGCSAIFVEWRLENGVWVISEIGDEEFRTDALPEWCC